MGKKIYSLFCLLCALFGGFLTASAQAFEAAPISSLAEITTGSNTYYALMAVDKKNAAGAWNSRNEAFLFVNSANASNHYLQFGTLVTKDDIVGKLESNPEYFFKLETSGDGYKFQNLKTAGYLYQMELSGKTFTQTMSSETEEPGVYTLEAYAEDYNGSKTFSIKDGANYLGQYSSGANVNNDYTEAGKFTFVIYKVAASATAVNASFYYYNADGTQLLNSDAFIGTVSESANTVGALSKALPAYVTAKFYADEAFTSEVAPETEVTASTTYYVKTAYNADFIYPADNATYFALKTGDNYLGTTFGLSPSFENRKAIALTLSGDWYNGYSLVAYDGRKLYYDGSQNIYWSETDYRWTIDNECKLKDASGEKYLAIYSTNCLLSTSFAAELATSAATAAILAGIDETQQYVGTYEKDQAGVTFDDIVKGKKTAGFTEGTYYFIENAANTATTLSASGAVLGSDATLAAPLSLSDNPGFAELWVYADGKLKNLNTGLYLAASADLQAEGASWTLAANDLGGDYAFNITAGGTPLALDAEGNVTTAAPADDFAGWKFHKASRITLPLIYGDNGTYAAISSPVALSTADTNTKIYAGSELKGNVLYLEESTLQPGAGYIVLNSAYAAAVSFDIVPAAGEASSLLSGTNVALEVAAGSAADYRAFTFTGLTPIFAAPETTIAANTAYLKAGGAELPETINISTNQQTGIKFTFAAPDASASAPVYDLSGRRTGGNLGRGIYIQNNRKFFVK
ncbi:MAG: hypothetical protein ACI3X6_02115 [Alloprevotella sp.]